VGGGFVLTAVVVLSASRRSLAIEATERQAA
jgi:hypothetical protein